MADIFIEVEEAMKRERLEKYWKSYGNLMIFCVLAIILGTGAYSAYSAWHKDVTRQQTDVFLEAAKLNDPAKLADTAENLNPGLKSIAKLKAAGELLTKKDVAGATALYKEVAEDSKAPVEYKELAKFMTATLSTDPQDSLKTLEIIAADTKNPFRYHAHLQAALLMAHNLNDYSAARKHLAAIIAEENVPPTLKAKANGLDVIYALKEIEQK